MKLRNKKTGEIWDIGKVLTNDYPCWETLNQICDDWEDVEDIDVPSMPLIKDEKVRNVIRSWAEANDMDVSLSVFYREDRCTLSALHAMKIEFSKLVFADLEKNRSYTIAELCGEEEE